MWGGGIFQTSSGQSWSRCCRWWCWADLRRAGGTRSSSKASTQANASKAPAILSRQSANSPKSTWDGCCDFTKRTVRPYFYQRKRPHPAPRSTQPTTSEGSHPHLHGDSAFETTSAAATRGHPGRGPHQPVGRECPNNTKRALHHKRQTPWISVVPASPMLRSGQATRRTPSLLRVNVSE